MKTPSHLPPAADPRLTAARAMTVAAPAVLAVALMGALAGREPFHTWFYSFAWWSVILFLDGCVYRRRRESLLLSHPGRFAFFSLFSIGLWFLFEAANLRLGNWSYVGLPADPMIRWAGYFLSFATVAPAIMEMADLVDTAEFMEGHTKPLARKPALLPALLASGAAMLVLALLWPRLFFPLLWVAFIPFFEPINDSLRVPSLLTDWREGSMRRLRVLLVAGLLCGALWEAFNMPAGARWVYHLPGLDRFKIFEMPLPGYLGFPAFALEVFAMSSFALTVWERSPRAVKLALAVGWLSFAFTMCAWVDKGTAGL